MSALSWFAVCLGYFTFQHISLVEGVPVTSLLTLAVPTWMLWARWGRLDPMQIRLWAFAGTAGLVSCALNASVGASYPSTIYLAILSAIFAVLPARQSARRARLFKGFVEGYQAFMMVCVLLGALQVSLGEEFVSVRDAFPDDWLLAGFNTSNRMEVGDGHVYRSNGFFFLEPSFFSQYLAFALLLEMWQRRRPAIIGFFGLGMLLSLSGTGFVLLAVGLLLMAFRRLSARNILLTIAPVVLLIGAVVYFLPTLADRLDELQNEDASGYWRFVMPILYVQRAYAESLLTALLGLGPGISKNSLDTLLMAYSSGIGKILYENGLFGALPLLMLYYRFSRAGPRENWFTAAMLVFLLIINCGLQDPTTLLFMFMLTFYMSSTRRPSHTRTRTRRRAPVLSTRGARDGLALSS